MSINIFSTANARLGGYQRVMLEAFPPEFFRGVVISFVIGLFAFGARFGWAENMVAGCEPNANGEIILRLNAVVRSDADAVPLSALLTSSTLTCLPSSLGDEIVVDMKSASEQRVGKHRLEQLLETTVDDGPGFEVLGPDYVLIRSSRQRIAAATIIDSAKSKLSTAIQSRFAVQNLRLTAGDNARINSRYINQRGSRYAFRWQPGEYVTQMEAIWVDVFLSEESEEIVESFPLWFKVSGDIEAYRLARQVFRLNRLSSSLLVKDVVDIAELRSAPVMSDEDFAHVQFRRDVAAGSVLTSEMLRDVPAVSAGAFVTVRVAQERLSLEAVMVAANDAYLGESVRVKSPSSSEYFLVKVIGNNLAVVAR